ncbi:MAG: cupin [Dehalococcoidia bacterium]|nr:cupin [Dehalococcoidia bacterium]
MPAEAVHTRHQPGTSRPTDDALETLIRAEGVEPHWWSNTGGDRYQLHQHSYHKVLYCAAGSVTFQLPGSGEQILLRPGDRLDLPPGIGHTAFVGRDGVRCVEGWVP